MDFFRGVSVVFSVMFLTACATSPVGADTGVGGKTKPVLSGTKKTSQNNIDDSAYAENLVKEYHIGVDDVVQVSVWKNENLSVKVPVRPDGKISIPLAGDVMAGGLTPSQVAKSIKHKLSAYIRDPQVTVILTELHSHEYLSRVRVTGAVRTPISVSYRQGMTVLDLVLAAGGVTEFASPNGTRLYRKIKGKVESFRVRLGDILSKGKLSTNLAIEPGDVITVPERLF